MQSLPAVSAANDVPSSAHNLSISIDVTCDAKVVQAAIEDRRDEVVSVFAALNAAQRVRLADDAWFLGIRCVLNAHRLAEESRLEDVGRQLATTFETQLTGYQERQQAAFLKVVKDYFDPHDGRVPLRIDAFLGGDGALARTMSQYLAPGGELEKTLARAVGEASPLLRALSPTESQGVVQLVETKVRDALNASHADLSRALDPLTKEGTMGRFLTHLREEMLKADNDRGKQLAAVAKALDANDEASALSRLLRETQSSSRSLLRAINGDDPTSALGAIKASLHQLLDAQGKAQLAALQALDERQRKDALETREALARLEERRRADHHAPRGGVAFEAIVAEAIGELTSGAPLTIDATGNSNGLQAGCKVGDLVVRYTSESAYAGSALVVEAKHAVSYSPSKALEELAVARANRGAAAGLFVYASSHAPPAFPRISRHGQDVLMVWDETDPGGLVVLQCALVLALSLAAHHQRPQDPGAIDALCRIEGRVMAELKRLEKMRKLADNIRRDADLIAEEVRIGTKKMRGFLVDTKKTLRALDVELRDEEAAADEPIELAISVDCAAE